jgi:hypothetical protein
MLADARDRCIVLQSQGYEVRAGGPAVVLNPDYLADVAELGGAVAALPHHHPDACFTTRGCIRRCGFCAVPRLEGDLVELEEWEPARLVCDNNLLAASRVHFDRVVDRLKSFVERGARALPPSVPPAGREEKRKPVDFNQGLDARLLTEYHASRLAELDCLARLAFDHSSMEMRFLRAVQRLRDAGFPKRRIRVYVLIGWQDTPEDAAYRLGVVKDLKLLPFPMRFEPLDAWERGAYVGKGWTDRELRRFMKYWSNFGRFGSIPFEEFRLEDCSKTKA